MGQTSSEPLRASFGKVIAVGADAGEPVRIQPPAPVPSLTKPAQPTLPRSTDGALFYSLQLTPPDKGRLFIVEAEDAFRDRLRQEARDRGVRHPLDFPGSTAPPPTRAAPRYWIPYTKIVEPSYVVSVRLFWEQPTFERYGVSLGVLQPSVSTGIFFFDTVSWPVRRLARPLWWNQLNTDCNSPHFYLVGEQDAVGGVESAREQK